MGKLIQVYGLPRSGTAFVSTMLNLHPGCMAHHELLGKTDQFRQIIDRNLQAWDYVADVNTYGWMLKNRKEGDVVIKILRPVKESITSIHQVIPNDNIGVGIIFNTAYERLRELDGYVYYYKDLFRMETLEGIWNVCFSNRNFGVMFDSPRPFPSQKVHELLSMKVTAFDVPAMIGKDVAARIEQHIDVDLLR